MKVQVKTPLLYANILQTGTCLYMTRVHFLLGMMNQFVFEPSHLLLLLFLDDYN